MKTFDESLKDLLDRRDESSYSDAYWGIAERFRAGNLTAEEAAKIQQAADVLGKKIGRPGWACIPGHEPWQYG